MTTREQFADVLSAKFGIPAEEITDRVSLDELELDSLAMIELSVAVQKRFGVVLDESELMPTHTVADVVGVLAAKDAAA